MSRVFRAFTQSWNASLFPERFEADHRREIFFAPWGENYAAYRLGVVSGDQNGIRDQDLRELHPRTPALLRFARLFRHLLWPLLLLLPTLTAMHMRRWVFFGVVAAYGVGVVALYVFLVLLLTRGLPRVQLKSAEPRTPEERAWVAFHSGPKGDPRELLHREANFAGGWSGLRARVLVAVSKQGWGIVLLWLALALGTTAFSAGILRDCWSAARAPSSLRELVVLVAGPCFLTFSLVVFCARLHWARLTRRVERR